MNETEMDVVSLVLVKLVQLSLRQRISSEKKYNLGMNGIHFWAKSTCKGRLEYRDCIQSLTDTIFVVGNNASAVEWNNGDCYIKYQDKFFD